MNAELKTRGETPLIPEPVEIIPLGEAQLCQDCNCITRSRNRYCLACGSQAVFKIVSVLDRQADGEKDSVSL